MRAGGSIRLGLPRPAGARPAECGWSSGPTEDVTDLHAWAEVYIPGAGWIGLDPTSALFAGEGHIPLAATPHPASAAAITGATEPSVTTMEFANTVRRAQQDPRTTLPYTATQIDDIQQLGEAVDGRLQAAAWSSPWVVSLRSCRPTT